LLFQVALGLIVSNTAWGKRKEINKSVRAHIACPDPHFVNSFCARFKVKLPTTLELTEDFLQRPKAATDEEEEGAEEMDEEFDLGTRTAFFVSSYSSISSITEMKKKYRPIYLYYFY
jgi:hypothetical protein